MNDIEQLPADDADEPRPWQQPGFARRDLEPHRGLLIFVLGGIAGLFGMLAGVGAVTAPLAVALGMTTWLLARGDLDRMRRGLMDSAGRRFTERGRNIGLTGAALGLLFLAVFTVFWFE